MYICIYTQYVYIYIYIYIYIHTSWLGYLRAAPPAAGPPNIEEANKNKGGQIREGEKMGG